MIHGIYEIASKADYIHDLASNIAEKEFNINFRNRQHYKDAVRVLMNSKTLILKKNGRYLSGPEYGYVCFMRRCRAEVSDVKHYICDAMDGDAKRIWK